MKLIATWIGVDYKKERNHVSSYFVVNSCFLRNTKLFPRYNEGMNVFCPLQYSHIFYCFKTNKIWIKKYRYSKFLWYLRYAIAFCLLYSQFVQDVLCTAIWYGCH